MSSDTYDIREYGAGEGQLATAGIQKAVDAAAAQHGGTVVVPAGEWVSGSIYLKSGVTFLITPGAVLKAADDINLFSGDLEGHNDDREKHHFIIINDQEHVVVTGGGRIDGNGPHFWLPPAEGSKWFRRKRPRISPLIEIDRSRHITFDNLVIENSPGWTIHPYCSDHLIFRGVTVNNFLYGPNTDGIDINGCRDVFISDCRLTCGDDCIIIKATPDARSTERVMVSNCSVETNCIGIGIGQETLSDVRQVTVTNCIARRCHRLFAIGMWEGGVVEDVTVTNLVGDTLTEDNIVLARPLQLEAKQHAVRGGEHCTLRNVQISNVVARTCGRSLMTAQEGMLLENIVLRDIHQIHVGLEDAARLSPPDGKTGSSQYANRNLEARKKHAALVVENAKRFVLDGFQVTWPEEKGDLPYKVLWGRNIDQGVIRAPFASACGGGDPFELINCTIQ